MCTFSGTAGGEDRSLPAQGPQGGEEEPEASAWARDTEAASPGRQGPSPCEMRSLPACWCVSGVTSESKGGFAQSLPLRGEEWSGGLCIIPGTLRNDPRLTRRKASFGLCLRPLLLIVSGPGGACRKARVCLNSLWNSADGLEVSRILWFPQLYWAFAFISQHFLPCVSHFHSTQKTEEWLLVVKLLWAVSNH